MRIHAGIAGMVVVAACSTGDPAAPSSRRIDEATIRFTADFASGQRLRVRGWDVANHLVFGEFLDTLRNEPCSFQDDGEPGSFHSSATAGSGGRTTYWCLPRRMARHGATGVSAVFADKDCTVPLAIDPDDFSRARAPDEVTYAINVPLDACASAPTIHRAGPKKSVRPYFALGEGQCVRALSNLDTRSLDDIVPLDAFERAEESVEDRAFSAIASHVLVTADGARLTMGGFDRKRLEPVRFDDATASHESPRWIPSRVAFVGAEERYGDDKCTKALPTKVARTAICPLTAALVFLDQCGRANIHALGARRDQLFEKLLEEDGSTTCNATSGATDAFAFDLGPDISAALAPAHTIEVGGDVLRRRGLGAGGDVVVWSDLVDVAVTKEPCEPVLAVDGVFRCLPKSSATISLFADGACTTPALAVPTNECDRKRSAVRFYRARVAGEAGARVFEIVSDAPALFASKDGTCVPFTPSAPSRQSAMREVDITRFAIAREVEVLPAGER